MSNLTKVNSFRRHLIIGDFNLPSVKWPDCTSTCGLESDFIDFLCGDLGHCQLVNSVTHVSGNTLDLLFTNCSELISDMYVCGANEVCCSDHFGLRFNINLKVSRSTHPPRYRYDFRNFNFLPLNVALARVNWDCLLYTSPSPRDRSLSRMPSSA